MNGSAPSRTSAVVEATGSEPLTYRALGELSDRLRDWLVAMGVERGDRVGIYLRKSADAVAAIFGALKAGAAYLRRPYGSHFAQRVHPRQLRRQSRSRGAENPSGLSRGDGKARLAANTRRLGRGGRREALKRALDTRCRGRDSSDSLDRFGAGRSCLYSIHLRLDRYP